MAGKNQEFPFTAVPGTDAEMFIQWKGTNLCIDFWCPCGQHCHFDGYFAHHLKCPTCGDIFEMGTQVLARRATEEPPFFVEMDASR